MIAIIVSIVGMVGAIAAAYLTSRTRNEAVIVREENSSQHAASKAAIELLTANVIDMRDDLKANSADTHKIADHVEALDGRVTTLEEKFV
jgi:LPS O-antigen subunit length determinant protein (WzzB/FepE family)